MSEKYDVIVIGAGLGGLTAGTILAKNGMKVLILEKNHTAGGAVTTFYKNGYPIDITHALCALKEGAIIKKMFDYLDITKEFETVELEKTFLYATKNERNIACYSDINKYSEELSYNFPEETQGIRSFLKEVESIWSKEILKSNYNPSVPLLFLYPFIFHNLFKYRKFTFDQFLDKFNFSPKLKDVVSVGWPYLGLPREKVSALYMICLLGSYHLDKTFFIKGGFGKITDAIVNKFEGLGGKINYNTKCEKIIFKNRTACGVNTNKGDFFGEKIISNADTKKTFQDLIGGSFSKTPFSNISKLAPSCSILQIHFVATAEIRKEFLSCGSIKLAIDFDLESKLKQFIKYAGDSSTNSCLIISIHSLNEFNHSNNMFVFNVGYFSASYYLWKKLRVDYGEKEYNIKKEEVARILIDYLRNIFPISEIKCINVFTPVSYEKWLGATEGAIYDSACTPQQILFNRQKNKTKIKNLLLVGSKTFPGPGIIGALISAFSLSDTLLDGKLTQGKILLR